MRRPYWARLSPCCDGSSEDAIRISIRVKPGASRTRVGGRYGDDALVIAVTPPAVEGRATSAALKALAQALGRPVREISLIAGATSRTKGVELPDDCAQAVAGLLDS